MILHLTPEQMLERWRLHRGLLPVTDNDSVTSAADTTLDTLLRAEIEEWYRRLLAEGPIDLNAPVEYADNVRLPATVAGEGVTLALPDEAVRLTAVRLLGWECDARIIADPRSHEARMQLDPYTRATPSDPVAVLRPGGFVTLYPSTGDNILETLRCTARHDDLYHFDEAAMGIGNGVFKIGNWEWGIGN